MFASLTQRRHQAELMDQSGLDVAAHRQALRGLQRVNWFSRSVNILWPEIRTLTESQGKGQIGVLDVASGGGDVAIGIAKAAVAANLSVRVEGCDISTTAVQHATDQARRTGLSNISFYQADALHDDLPEQYDVVMCSLFLHHLTEEDAVLLLRRMKQYAKQLVLVNDLRRTRLGYAMAWLGCRLLSRSPIVHADGPVSVEGAFTCEEALVLAEKAGLAGATVSRRWPQRFLLRWSAA